CVAEDIAIGVKFNTPFYNGHAGRDIAGNPFIGVVSELIDSAWMGATPPHRLIGGGIYLAAHTAVDRYGKTEVAISESVLHTEDEVGTAISQHPVVRIFLGKSVALENELSTGRVHIGESPNLVHTRAFADVPDSSGAVVC